MASSSESKQGDEAVVAKVVNVAKIRTTADEPTLLHFTPEQWKHAVEGLKRVDKLSEDHLTLEVVSMPGAPGIMLAAIKCPPDCEPYYEYDSRMPEDFTSILAGCRCGDPPLPLDPPSSPCRLAIQFGSGDLRLPSLICVDTKEGKECPDYEPAIVARSEGVYILGCIPR